MVLLLLIIIGFMQLFESSIGLPREQHELNSALLRHGQEFVEACEARTPRVRVITVANRMTAESTGGARLGLCCLAKSLDLVGSSLGVLGLSTFEPSRRVQHYINNSTLRHLGVEFDQDVTTVIGSVDSMVNLLLLDYFEFALGERQIPGKVRTSSDNLTHDDLIIFVDAFDVVAQQPLREVVRRYCQYQWQAYVDQLLQIHSWPESNKGKSSPDDWATPDLTERIVFAASETCYPFPGYWGYWNKAKAETATRKYAIKANAHHEENSDFGPFLLEDEICLEQERHVRGERRFLNAGGFVGRVADIRRFLQHTVKDTAVDGMRLKQEGWILTLLKYPQWGILDSEARIFLQLHSERRGKTANTVPISLDNITFPIHLRRHVPVFLHFDGNSKRIYNKLVKELVGEHVFNTRFAGTSSPQGSCVAGCDPQSSTGMVQNLDWY